MKFHESGLWDAPVLLLLPGTCCHWRKNFGHVLPLLNQRFHVVCASYDGFDETEDTTFTTVTDQVEEIEVFVQQSFGGRIHAVYGCSLGGSLHFAQPHIVEHDLMHEELLVCQPEKWVQEVCRAVE